MTNRPDTYANGVQLSGSKKKKKKKNKNLKGHDGEKSDEGVTPPLSSASERSSSFSEPVGYQDVGDGEAYGKKSKKKKKKKDSRERFDSQSDRLSVVAESELNSDSGTPTRNKKRKQKRKPSEQDAGDEFCVPETPEVASDPPEEGHFENVARVYESTPLKKKKKPLQQQASASLEQAEGRQTSIRDAKDRTNSTSPSKQEQMEVSEAADTEEMTNRPDTYANGVQLSGLKQKKKKKKKNENLEEHDGEKSDEGVTPPLSSAFERSSSFSEPVGYQDVGDGEAYGKKSKKKKKASRERFDSQSDRLSVVAESELNSDSGTPTRNKKRKQKRKPSKQDLGDEFCVPETQEVASDPPEEGHFENVAHVYESTPLKKKKKKQQQQQASASLAEQASVTDTNGGSDSAHPGKRDQTNLSEKVDKEMDIVAAPTPSRKTRRSDLSQAKGKQVAGADWSHPDAGKKLRKRKKPHRTDDSDSAGDGLAVEETESLDLKSGQGSKPATSKGSNRLRKSRLPVHTDAQDSSSTRHPSWETCSLTDDELPGSYDSAYSDLETATKELEEFIPHVRSLSKESIRTLAYRDLARFKQFKKQGIAVKFGRFSKKENKLLKKNVEEFLNESGIDSAEKLFFTHRFPEERGAISKLKCELLFGVKIAEGLPRPWRLVYYRARKIFDPQNYNGLYSEEEKKKLIAYQAIHGNDWKKISQLMNRSSRSVAWKYSHIKCKPNFGPWSQKEKNKLVRAIEAVLRAKARGLDSALDKEDPKQVLTVVREHLYRGIPWSQIEAKVGTRHWKQCKQKWNSIVTKRMSMGQTKSYGTENVKFKINLIERLHKLNIEDENEIDWEDFSDIIGNVTPAYVQSRFYKLKNQHVPSWRKKDFPDIIDYLYEKTLPDLKSTFGKRTTKEAPAVAEPKKKEVFQFSDIFQNLTSEEDED